MRRNGTVLLEVVVAIALTGIAAMAFLEQCTETRRSVLRGIAHENELRDAGAFLEIVALWPREALDQRLGTRAQGRWMLSIVRPHPSLYRLALLDSGSRALILGTEVFRTARSSP